MNSVRSHGLNLEYERFTLSVCKDIGMRKFEFARKTHLLSLTIFIKKMYACIEKTTPPTWSLSSSKNYCKNNHRYFDDQVFHKFRKGTESLQQTLIF